MLWLRKSALISLQDKMIVIVSCNCIKRYRLAPFWLVSRSRLKFARLISFVKIMVYRFSAWFLNFAYLNLVICPFFEITFQGTFSNFVLSWYFINQNFEVFSGLPPITTTQIVKLENENRDLTAKLRKTRLMLNDNTTRSSGSTLNSTILPLYNPGLIRILIRDI